MTECKYEPNTVKTLCWSCANATGSCSWSEYGSFQPVPGWKASKAIINAGKNSSYETYVVHECPEYICDSLECGLVRLNK